MAFAYGQLSLFLHIPDPVHMAAAKRALAYVRGTHDQGLSCCDPGAENRNVLTGWVDSDFAADSDTCRSVTGYIMSLNGASAGSCGVVSGLDCSGVWKDNAACILLKENPVHRDHSRHVDIKFHFLRERVRASETKSHTC